MAPPADTAPRANAWAARLLSVFRLPPSDASPAPSRPPARRPAWQARCILQGYSDDWLPGVRTTLWHCAWCQRIPSEAERALRAANVYVTSGLCRGCLRRARTGGAAGG